MLAPNRVRPGLLFSAMLPGPGPVLLGISPFCHPTPTFALIFSSESFLNGNQLTVLKVSAHAAVGMST